KGRVDLRDLPLVTIDGEDARDFDDAVYCAPKKGGGWRLWVAIADVSYYVRPQTALDTEARSRGNSVYFPSQVVPMLPEVLSNGLCSLNPGVDRLCMVCEMTVSASGKLSSYKFYEAVMSSHARLTYTK
ncbi:RNB domain-containing ribonuclease, partial [Escherichia coli]|nr:RNB domain-containing ribonuclease [Escherichia coli]